VTQVSLVTNTNVFSVVVVEFCFEKPFRAEEIFFQIHFEVAVATSCSI